MRADEPIDEYAAKLTSMSVRYSNLGGTLDDAAMVKKLFDTVPERFIAVVAGIEQFYDLKTLVFEEAIGRLKAFEELIQRGAGSSGAKTTSDGQVLLTFSEWEARQKKNGAVIPRGEVDRLMVAGVAVVEGAGEVVVVAGVEMQPDATLAPRRTRSTFSASIAKIMGTTRIGAQRRRREMKLIMRRWRTWSRRSCSRSRRCRSRSSRSQLCIDFQDSSKLFL
jgi:hypothetical protein